MASIKKRPDGKWRARYRDGEGKEHSRHFARKVDAELWVTEQAAAVARGQHVDPSDKTTVAEYARTWAAARPHRPRTARRISIQIEKHVAATPLGSRRLAAVRPSEVQSWATGRAQVLAPSTMRVLVGMLRSIYASAVLDRLVASSPVVRIVLPKATHARIVPLTVEQVRALAEATPERYRAMVVMQAALGLRLGELLALHKEDVDFLRRSVRIEWQIAEVTRERVEPKTPRSRRTLPLPTFASEALAEHIRRFPPAKDGTLFHTSTGKPYDHAHYGSKIFRKAVAAVSGRAAKEAAEYKAGRRKAEPLAPIPADTTPHDLRHHYASVLLAAGESVIAVAERLGHENANLVLSTYGHLMPNSEDRTRKALEDAWKIDNGAKINDAADSVRTDQG